ncbi:Chitin-inducible gibberellin-responsive protein 1 [Zostera marina]|uniref:Chitin-inducible gibberellin-responsive protein 1 n=1 Tax=Zostera marina TaxID=29655 RepID=A0A0K9NPU9_ZOSMR|nr:Chitin-inducible gibberellin-responsive protein 1 [Zostera marina]
MDRRQFYKPGVPNSMFPSAPFSEILTQPIIFNIGVMPNSPHWSSRQVDGGDTISVQSDSVDQQGSSEALSTLNTNSSNIASHIDRVASGFSQSEMSALQELENLLMAPDIEEDAATSSYADLSHGMDDNRQSDFVSRKCQKLSHQSCPKAIQHIFKNSGDGGVRSLLIECARAMSEDRLDDFKMLVMQTEKLVSICGDPIQRLGAYMREGLLARQEASGSLIYRTLKCHEPEGKELLSHMQTLYDICPYFKFGYMAANGAIAESVKNEDNVHIIDFQIAQGTQWITLIKALAARPGGPPYLRITGVDDPVNRYARGDGLDTVGKRLKTIAEKSNIPLEFKGLSVFGPDVTREMLDIRPGEAVAVNFTLQLHHTPDESVDVSNPRDGLLRMVKGLSPKVTTLVEQESNTNTAPFFTRFTETLDYYYAMFESIDVTLPRDSKDRINVEQSCLAKDIVNIIACEGKDRLERHELLGKWISRLTMAGFKPLPLSSYVNSVIKSLLGCYSDKYTLVEKDGAMLLGWKDRNLISASAWH